MVEKLKFIWMDGKLVNWDNANVHVLTHSLHYGLGAFEGIRSYETVDSKSAIFRLQDHIRRLFDSAHIVQIKIPFSINALINACKETVKANDIKESYIRPIAYIGEGAIGVNPKDNPIGVSIIVTKMGKYLGKEAMEKGAKVKISSFTRYFVNSAMTRAKLTGNYMTSVLAKREVVSLGFDEALMLDTDGFIAEGTGENIFIVKNGILKTTPFTSILPGITRSTVIQVAKDFGYEVREDRFTRDELYIADEAFFTGTAAEVTPIGEVDGRVIGKGGIGPITKKIQTTYFDIIRGKNKKYAEWLTYV